MNSACSRMVNSATPVALATIFWVKAEELLKRGLQRFLSITYAVAAAKQSGFLPPRCGKVILASSLSDARKRIFS